ncbi:MAG TPA: xanthine dehydrogenase family protein molybdopterin-binding subunit [Alphaproteobacteria bacterium]|nr:xanthine dehydrogenase family protein molybdopterin-binding subunit [Alphaproteobacteria bacterium]
MPRFGVGQPLTRKEDLRLLTGRGRYVDDLSFPNQARAEFLRSPHAHARIVQIDVEKAKSASGVCAVYVSADIANAGLGGLPVWFMPENAPPGYAPEFPLLAQDVVRYVGESLAMIVAESAEQAARALDLIEVKYESLPTSVGLEEAASDGAPELWPGKAPFNVAFLWQGGDMSAVVTALRQAAHLVEIDVINNRVAIAAIECRAAIGVHDAIKSRSTLYTTSQMPHPLRADLAAIFNESEDQFRVVIGDVGGGFGSKNSMYGEQALVIWAARMLDRPIKWVGERSDAFITDFHGRDNVTHGELALDQDGNFLGMLVDVTANLGAYISGRGAISPVLNQPALAGTYRTPAIHVRVRGMFTNTVPTDVYRGAGRPEAIYLLERLIDKAADELNIDRVELRRRNMIPADAFPYETPLGLTYDGGLFERNLDEGLRRMDWDGMVSRRAEARARGRRRGIGLANYVERCGHGITQDAQIKVAADGGVTVLIGTMSSGQGHETAYAQISAELLGVQPSQVKVIQGDTDLVAQGKGTGGSWSIPVGGAAMSKAADAIIDKGKEIASHLLEASSADIEFSGGYFTVAGTDHAMDWSSVAASAYDPTLLPEGMTPGLEGTGEFVPSNHTFPNGCHLCEVELDPKTGSLDIVRYLVVHDFGVVLNPLLLEGQVHGGVAQGLGQAVFERTYYDNAGQFHTSSFLDYNIPRADEIPSIEFISNPTPCPANPLGFKGCGEAGAAGAPPAVVNAVVDALKEFGVKHIDMPLTPERIWRTINNAATKQDFP